MKEHKIKFKAFAAFLALSVILLIILFFSQISTKLNATERPQRSIFSWHEEFLTENERTDFYTVIEYLNIDCVYQRFSHERLCSKESEKFINDLKIMKKSVYYLCGEPEWGLEDGLNSIKNEIDKVVEYNSWSTENGTISGIVLDVEPYLTDDWDDDKDAVVEIYIDNITSAYAYAKDKGIETVICIPNWLDNEHYEELAMLISKGCDVVAVMNYNRRNEEESIRTELSLSVEHQKRIECIFEFQAVGKYGLTKNQTYAEQGIDAAIESFEKLSNSFDYEKFGYSFHSYDPIRELLKDKNSILGV